ncbi:hypothetical protein vseg_010838 [Gypsophila vaccaria]
MQRLTIVAKLHTCFLGSNLIHPISLFSTSSSSSSSNYCLADHLVNSLGFSHQQAVSISSRLSKRKMKVDHSNSVVNAFSVVIFFRTRGFHDTLIRGLVNRYPPILSCKVDKTLNPKLRFLQQQGFSQSNIIRLVSANHRILTTGVESFIFPRIQILRQVMGACNSNDGRVIRVVSNSSERIFHAILNFLLPNVDLLRSYGVPIEKIREHVVQRPWCYVRPPDILKDIMTKVEYNLGIRGNSPGFLYAIQLLSCLSEEALESKCRLFKSFGWTQSDLETLLAKNASCFALSETLIEKKLGFLMNDLQYKLGEKDTAET